MALLTALDISEEASVWEGLGFEVSDGAAWVSGVAHRLGATGPAIAGWSLWGLNASAAVDGLPTAIVEEPTDPVDRAHPNGVIGLDHLVVSSPDLDRTFAALEGIGLGLVRVREAGSVRQGFFRLGPVILEVVGRAGPAESGAGPAAFLGLAWTCADLAATAAFLGPRLHAAKEAVQPGRQIATLDREAGSRVAMAFMSPAPGR